ncbi:nucleotide exchange factor GrpE [Evansella cellulosilytica]|uniref:Nucleotide exchange factor GrpE n=1 Tax=Evansella cellulosilytica (strain ATCC 21833 / DSM 2522 / FERM P-1141 / JCM 9156 / N-4) TaxID=649639 RepID=E6TT45_EVAC2|nr:nucleotide exchange factor GrpE [Evansella cellulosilytica]ADU31953.1 hypothetical protein Bcell_3713 [Evansella cellulosilytica DSM 2522]
MEYDDKKHKNSLFFSFLQGKKTDVEEKTVKSSSFTRSNKWVDAVVGVKQYQEFTALLSQLIVIDLYIETTNYVKQINKIFLENGYASWAEEGRKTEEKLLNMSSHFKEGEVLMMDASLKAHLIDQLVQTKPLESFYVTEEKLVETSGDVHELLSAVKDDVKKGNRASFKLFQQLEEKFEQFTAQMQQDQHDQMEEAVQSVKKDYDKLQQLLLEMFDQVDVIYQACTKLNDEVMCNEVAKVINKGLLLLEEHGIEEIKVEGELIDGKTMISLGNVPREKYAPHLEKYEVYSVQQRGFRRKDTKEIIRKATVITVD